MKDWTPTNVHPVVIFADTTGQFSDDELNEMEMGSLLGQMIEIPVPENLLFKWWQENYGGDCGSRDEFSKWFYEESTADDTHDLYQWLCGHNYFWKKIDETKKGGQNNG